MTKEEILNYLHRKRVATAPVATAENNLRVYRNRFELAKKKGNWLIGFLWFVVILFVLVLLYGLHKAAQNPMVQLQLFSHYEGKIELTILGYIVISVILLIGLKTWKKKRYVDPAYDNLVNAEQTLNEARNSSSYLDEAQSFPSEFYNYTDVYRLWRLVDEGRASSLQDAYNLLEKQHFYEDQLAIQEEIRSLQQDTAAAARATAVASTMTAYNTAKLNRY